MLHAGFYYRSCTFASDSWLRLIVTGYGTHWPEHGLGTQVLPRETVSSNLKGAGDNYRSINRMCMSLRIRRQAMATATD